MARQQHFETARQRNGSYSTRATWPLCQWVEPRYRRIDASGLGALPYALYEWMGKEQARQAAVDSGRVNNKSICQNKSAIIHPRNLALSRASMHSYTLVWVFEHC